MMPFRTLSMLAGLVSIIIVSRLTQKIAPATKLEIVSSLGAERGIDLGEHLVA